MILLLALRRKRAATELNEASAKGISSKVYELWHSNPCETEEVISKTA